MATPHKYPTGRADFEPIINEGFLYVDKTERMYEMIGDRKFVFLSRPRRFGKSLLVNTLCAYFEGKKELFKGLKISEYEKDWIKYPVIKLDMSVIFQGRHRSFSRKTQLHLRTDDRAIGVSV